MSQETDVKRSRQLPDPTALQQGELSRSSRTRQSIVKACVTCLARDGYAKTSTNTVSKEAGITRAAMLYHFPSRAAVIEATINYVTRERIAMYKSAMAENPNDEGFFSRAIDLAWALLQTPEFRAFTELSLAAKTDEGLAKMFEPALEVFDHQRKSLALELFPDRYDKQGSFDLRRDIVRFLTEGLAQQGGMTFNQDERLRNILNFLKCLGETPEGKAILQKSIARSALDTD